jgi:nucleolar protein 56
MNLPKRKKTTTLGVSDPKLAGSIKDVLGKGYEFDTGIVTQDLLRGIRFHAPKLFKQMQPGDLDRAQLGLGHAYSRAKVKFNVNKSDNMIIQAIALLDQLDKDINTFAMRVRYIPFENQLKKNREWYSWHFPELIKHVGDNYRYSQLALLIKDKSKLTEESLPLILEIVGDDNDLAQSIVDSAKMSMGQDISEMDMDNVVTFAGKVTQLADFRRGMHTYLLEKMNVVAPNLSALIGEMVGARLIAHAGSLTNLAKYPASTVQILGAEKALFRYVYETTN